MTYKLDEGAVESVEFGIGVLVGTLAQELRVWVQEPATPPPATHQHSVSSSPTATAAATAPPTPLTHLSTSFFLLAPLVPFLTRSILLITLTLGTSSPTMQLIALSTPAKYFAGSSMNCDSSR